MPLAAGKMAVRSGTLAPRNGVFRQKTRLPQVVPVLRALLERPDSVRQATRQLAPAQNYGVTDS